MDRCNFVVSTLTIPCVCIQRSEYVRLSETLNFELFPESLAVLNIFGFPRADTRFSRSFSLLFFVLSFLVDVFS